MHGAKHDAKICSDPPRERSVKRGKEWKAEATKGETFLKKQRTYNGDSNHDEELSAKIDMSEGETASKKQPATEMESNEEDEKEMKRSKEVIEGGEKEAVAPKGDCSVDECTDSAQRAGGFLIATLVPVWARSGSQSVQL